MSTNVLLAKCLTKNFRNYEIKNEETIKLPKLR